MPQSTDPNAPDYVNPTLAPGPAPGQPGSKSNPYGQPGGPADPAQSNVTGYTASGIPIYANESDPTHLSTGAWRGGVANDVGRYRGMGASGAAPTPQIAQPDQARDLSNDAIGMLGARATGAETPADILARQQTAGAVAGIQSGAASVKGGAAARAAAARGAAATGARVQATGDQDQQALHARGMADAAGQYFGAASAQRGQEMGLANSQAQLEAQQRAQAEQRGEFYEGMGQDTKNAALGSALGQSSAATAAAAADRRASLAEGGQGWENTKDLVGGTTSGVSGAVSAYNKTQGGGSGGGGGSTGDPNDPNNPNYSGSDERMKRDIHPISDAEAARLAHAGDMMLGQQRASLDTGPSVGKHNRAPAPMPLLQAIGERIAADKASAPRYGYFDEDEGNSRPRISPAPQGYAASREGHPGAMFGAPPAAPRPPDPYAGQAPGTADFYAGAHHLMSKGDRDIALSDPRAKQEAFLAGQRHAVQGLGFDDMPAYAKGDAPANASERRQPAAAPHYAPDANIQADRQEKPKTATTPLQHNAERIKHELLDKRFGTEAPLPLQALQGAADTTQAVYELPKNVATLAGSPNEKPLSPPPGAEPPGYFGQLAARAKTALSDPRAKTGAHDSPMADANRSMAPSSYEYRPEYTPPEQKPGEVNVGPMANKMEANPVAKTAIVKDPQTGLLAIDKTKALKLVMGGLSSLQMQVDRMKGARP